MPETWVQPLYWEHSLKKGKATHSSILAGEFHGLYSLWGSKESDTTKQLSAHSGSPLKQFSWQIATLGMQLILTRRVKGENENNLRVHCLNSKYKLCLLREMDGLTLPSAMLSSLVKL